MAIAPEEAEELLRRDVAIVESQVRSATAGLNLTQGQFDALCSFTFNLGIPKLLKSVLLKKLRAGDLPGAAAEFGRWTKAGNRSIPGLEKRRADETVLFLKAVV
jgi:lysozyme